MGKYKARNVRGEARVRPDAAASALRPLSLSASCFFYFVMTRETLYSSSRFRLCWTIFFFTARGSVTYSHIHVPPSADSLLWESHYVSLAGVDVARARSPSRRRARYPPPDVADSDSRCTFPCVYSRSGSPPPFPPSLPLHFPLLCNSTPPHHPQTKPPPPSSRGSPAVQISVCTGGRG